MNAIRSLPLINRPSRSSSPAPSHVTAQGLTMLPPTGTANGKAAANANLAGLSVNGSAPGNAVPRSSSANKRGNSPTSSRAGTPHSVAISSPLPGAEKPQTGYMDIVSMRLNDSVNKACAGVDFKAKKGFKKGAGWSISECIAR